MTAAERRLLVAVHRWLRTNGWHASWNGWSDATTSREATVRVGWAEGVVSLSRQSRHGWPQWSTEYPVASVRQAVDLLAALEVLPMGLSSAYDAGRLDWNGELARLREENDRLSWHANRAETAAARAQQRERDTDERMRAAEAALWRVRTVKHWTNEDGRRFVFADDLLAATDPDVAARVAGEVPA